MQTALHSFKIESLLKILSLALENIPTSAIIYDVKKKSIILFNQQSQLIFENDDICSSLEALETEISHYIIKNNQQQNGIDNNQKTHIIVNTEKGKQALRIEPVQNNTKNGDLEYCILIADDIIAEKITAFKTRNLMYCDGLTGLPNLTLFLKRLSATLECSRQISSLTAAMYIDLDNFKNYNNAYGHAFGDKLLCAISSRLRGELRNCDMLARLGGDVFAIILPNLESKEYAEFVAQRLIDVVRPPFIVDNQSCSLTVSIGIALCPDDHNKPEQLMGYAHMALYEAKRNGRNRFERFLSGLNESARNRRNLEIDLRTALDSNHLKMYYQPIVKQDGQEISGYEALIRWEHPTRGLVMPMDFIPVAEETGFIHEVGNRALTLSCHEAASWGTNQTVSVNLSPIQFRAPGLVELVRNALADSGLKPERLELEITESVLLNNSQENIEILWSLKAIGISISLDDFGTGYSSLSYLRSFPFDRIKIDKSFVQDMANHKEALAIVRAITGMSSSLSIKTTAEGVETNAQALQLKEEGCSHFQGYLFGRPMPSDQRLKVLKAKF